MLDIDTRYLTAFISEKGNLASAYTLLGRIQEMLQQSPLEAYKHSLALNSSQNELLLKGIVYVIALFMLEKHVVNLLYT